MHLLFICATAEEAMHLTVFENKIFFFVRELLHDASVQTNPGEVSVLQQKSSSPTHSGSDCASQLLLSRT